jgi:ribosomal protein S4
MQRRQLNGDGGMEALRILKRRLSDVVYRAMLTDQKQSSPAAA